MKIGDLAARCGLSAHTLCYYERIGLLPRAHRDASRQRNYDSEIIAWIEFLQRLKTTGMPIRGMLCYARLRETGAATEAAPSVARRSPWQSAGPCRGSTGKPCHSRPQDRGLFEIDFNWNEVG